MPSGEAIARMAECAVQCNLATCGIELKRGERYELIGQVDVRIEFVDGLLISASMEHLKSSSTGRVAVTSIDMDISAHIATGRNARLTSEAEQIRQIAVTQSQIRGERGARHRTPFAKPNGSVEVGTQRLTAEDSVLNGGARGRRGQIQSKAIEQALFNGEPVHVQMAGHARSCKFSGDLRIEPCRAVFERHR